MPAVSICIAFVCNSATQPHLPPQPQFKAQNKLIKVSYHLYILSFSTYFGKFLKTNLLITMNVWSSKKSLPLILSMPNHQQGEDPALSQIVELKNLFQDHTRNYRSTPCYHPNDSCVSQSPQSAPGSLSSFLVDSMTSYTVQIANFINVISNYRYLSKNLLSFYNWF